MLAGSLLAYQTVSSAQQQTTGHLAIQQKLTEATRRIRVNVLESYISIDAYLLEPVHKEYKQQAITSIDTAITDSLEMKPYLVELLPNESEKIDALHQLLTQFKAQTEELFRTREDTNRQYPSLAVGSDIMQPNRNNFNNAIALALFALREESIDESNPALFATFIETRFLWTQVLSNFRLYLANRVGSFNENALPMQEIAVETMYGELHENLKQLVRYDEQEKLEFQTSAAVEDMITSAENWFIGFQKVKQIHNADGWRIDSKIMKESVVPLLDQMSSILTIIELRINEHASNNLDVLSSAATQQIYILLWSALFFLLFFASIFIATNRLVFHPIALVVKALKAEAFGKESVLLPEIRSKETEALIEAFSEMSKHVHKRQSDLEHQALHDALTSLPNRTLLQDRIEHDIQISRREQKHLSLLMIDLDRFKEINDALGHHIGDQILIEVGIRLTNNLRDIDTVARLGGDEFAILLPDTNQHQAVQVSQKILDAMKAEFRVNEIHLSVDLSIGISSFPELSFDFASLLQHADVAMYVAKQNQLGYSIYDAEKDEYSRGRLELINDLRQAIDSDSLSLNFQPLIDLSNNRIIGVESLLRWNHPELGNIPPDLIVSLAEQTGLMMPLTYWIMEHALKKVAIIRKDHDLHVSINISVFNLKDQHLLERVKSIIDNNDVPTEKIILEITESAMMSNPVNAIEILSQLDSMGFRIAVDDFGTGFSSLAYLKQLPVDELKIDKSFIINMPQNTSDDVIVRSTIELAHNLGLEVVAEGVEDENVYHKLLDYGCDTAQGFYMCKPLPADELSRWLKKSKYTHKTSLNNAIAS